MQACGHLSEFKSVKSARKARFAVEGAGLKVIILYLKSEWVGMINYKFSLPCLIKINS